MLEDLGKIIINWCEPKGFHLLDPVPESPGGASERHGSWDWTFCKKGGALKRFVSVALTSQPEFVGAPSASLYLVEVWAGADDDDRYIRRLTSEFQTSESEIGRQVVQGKLREGLQYAMAVAERLTSADLSESHLRPRATP